MFFLFIFTCYHRSFSHPIEAYFGHSIVSADQFISEQKTDLQNQCKNYGADYNLAVATIYPELLRYSIFKDFFELSALELLYINMGKNAADFSIGHFQMKPSFAEKIEQELVKNGLKQKYAKICKLSADDASNRRIRLERLKNASWQNLYLVAFLELAKLKLGPSGNYNVKHIAALYNLGLDAPLATIKNWINTCSFPYGAAQKNNPFSYAEISSWCYLTKSL